MTKPILTKSESKALNIIVNNKIYRPRDFGLIYFEGHEILNRMSNIGNGATKGVGAWFHAGKILRNLIKKNYIYKLDDRTEYEITKLGKEVLEK